MILQETYTLSNGVHIPKIGFGTWMIDDAKASQAVQDAISVGYRHIDTAQAYGNEKGVGEGISASGVSRDELFVTTKLAAEIKSYDEAIAAIDDSLEKLNLEYIDMMIIHSPKPWGKFLENDDHFFEGNREAWRALEDAYKEGKLHAIGVSNFEKEDLDNIIEVSTVKPMVNQILAHISSTPHELIKYTQSHDILVEAYSPIGHGALMNNEIVKSVAEKYGVSVPRLAIRYTLQLNLLPLPKATSIEHMKDNADVDFEISGEDMKLLQGIERIENYDKDGDMPVFNKQF